MTDAVRRKARQKNRPEGILFEDEENRITVWVRTWGQIIESARSRLQFFKEKLEYSADHDSGLEYLRKTHDKYLPKTAVFKKGDAGAPGAAETRRPVAR